MNNTVTKESAVNRLSTGLKHERLCYKIYGIVFIVLAAIIIVCGIASMIAGAYLTANEASTNELSFNSSVIISDDDTRVEINDDELNIIVDGDKVNLTDDDVAILAGAGVIFVSVYLIVFSIIFLAYGIVNLVLASKVGKYRKSDELTVKHAGSVASIVLAAIFNEIALIFVIINFVYAKRNRAVLEQI